MNKTHQCAACKKSFETKGGLKIHIARWCKVRKQFGHYTGKVNPPAIQTPPPTIEMKPLDLTEAFGPAPIKIRIKQAEQMDWPLIGQIVDKGVHVLIIP